MANWILKRAREVVEEKSETVGNVVSVYRRRAATFTYVKRTAGDYSWEDHNQETQIDGGPTDARVREYGADINPTTRAIDEEKVVKDVTTWRLAYTYTRTSL